MKGYLPRSLRQLFVNLIGGDASQFLIDNQDALQRCIRRALIEVDNQMPEEKMGLDIDLEALGQRLFPAFLMALGRFLEGDIPTDYELEMVSFDLSGAVLVHTSFDRNGDHPSPSYLIKRAKGEGWRVVMICKGSRVEEYCWGRLHELCVGSPLIIEDIDGDDNTLANFVTDFVQIRSR